MPETRDDLLEQLRDLVARHAGADPRTAVDGVLVSRHETSEPDYQLTEPLLVVMVQGGKRLYHGSRIVDYAAGECVLIAASFPLAGHFVDVGPHRPALAIGLRLDPAEIAALLPHLPARRSPGLPPAAGIATCEADARLLDACVRLLRLLDHPEDATVLAPLLRRELLWLVLTGPLGPGVAALGLGEGNLAQVGRAIDWIRAHLSEPVTVAGLAGLAGMSPSSFHRHFRRITGTTPVQYQKRLRLAEARTLLLTQSRSLSAVAHQVGYASPNQFGREYRRLYGAAPGHDAARLRAAAGAPPQR